MNRILLSHGGGGEEMSELIRDVIFKAFDNEILSSQNDSAILNTSKNIAFSTDSYVVTPIFFQGGDIGKIAVCGTINDLCMVGANPKYLSVSFIIEEGFLIKKFKKILSSMSKIAKENDVKIVCGDTKVVPKGKCDEIFINTSGIGEIISKIETKNLSKNAKILISGDIGRHGGVILAQREELNLSSNLQSDCKSLKPIIMELIDEKIIPLCIRDATRGGISGVLNEWASFCHKEILIYEENIKVCDEVLGICELLGFEAYDFANEGTCVLAVLPQHEKKALEILRKYNEFANCIGEVIDEKNARVVLENAYGSRRLLEMPKGELLPRIC